MMNRKILVGLVALLAANSLLLAEQPAYRPGVVLVRFANEPNATAKSTILNSALGRGGSSVKRDYTLVKGLSQVSLPTGVSVESAVASLKQSSSVLYAEPDYKIEMLAVPNDAMFGQLWGMRNTGQFGGTIGADIDATGAWDINTGSSNVIVAVIDTGVDYTHQDLAANMWHNPGEIPGNGLDDDNDGYVDDVYGIDTGDSDGNPMDDSPGGGHGTHVSGSVGAVGNNSTGVAGVCWHVKIMAIKITDANGGPGDWNGWVSNAITGIQYAKDKGAKVMNASWRAYTYSPILYDAIASARDAGVIFVAASGNENNNNDSNPDYPASYDLDNIISVMATTNTDQRASFSNYGLTTVDIGAPGQDILSTLPGNRYDYMDGTSMASPHVAGACALILSIDPTLTYSEVKQILLNTVDKTLPGLCVSGGRLNLAAAAQEAAMDTTPPTPSTAVWDIQPQATGLHTVTMRAIKATDRSGVEYYFECVNDVSKNSGWEPNTLYSFTTLSPGTTYGFRFRARDKSPQHNLTEWSTTLSTKTATGTDNLPPVSNPPRWAIMPQIITPTRTGAIPKVNMQAETAYDENGVQYWFEETTGTGISSGWQDSSSFTITYSFNNVSTYTFRLRVRDKSAAHNVTSWSVSASTRTQIGSRILRVPSAYSCIQAAIDAALNGDIVELSPYPVPPYTYPPLALGDGTYGGNVNVRFKGLAITVRSVDPTNPAIVAATIIDCQGRSDPCDVRRAFIFDQGEGSKSILAGITIRNAYVKGGAGNIGANGTLEDVHALDGNDGMPGEEARGGAILCTTSIYGPASPTIRNCVFENCVAEGGNGGNGGNGVDGNDYTPPLMDPCDANIILVPESNATPGGDAGRGGNGGGAAGGSIFSNNNCSPLIQDCTIRGCRILIGTPGDGGNGGNGGNDPNNGQQPGGNAGDGADANYLRGGGICAIRNATQIIGCTIEDCNAFAYITMGQPGTPGTGSPAGEDGNVGSSNHSYAHGGGVYEEMTSNAIISSTNFLRNQVGTSWNWFGDGFLAILGGDGGGFYGLQIGGITTTMSDCNFIQNSADINNGYGGGIYFYGPGNLILRNCHIADNNAAFDGGGACVYGPTTDIHDSAVTGNNAAYGGGMFFIDLILNVEDSNFLNNTAQEGGAAFIYDCPRLSISSSQITGNSASMPQRSQLEGGLGGGLACWNSDGTITDCLISSNTAADEGGAVFAEGFNNFPLQFINCLITDNTAIYAGGALSDKTWFWTELINCTLVNNSATDGTHGSGGGISCAEDWAWVEIYNSILWDNTAAYGPQIGVGSRFGSFGNPNANVEIYYSDVEGGADDEFVEDPVYDQTAVWWWAGTFDADPLFTSVAVDQPAFYLSQQAAGQLDDSPCLNAGHPAFVTIGWLELFVGSQLTTRTDLVEDAGIIDIGYHYKAGSVGSAGKYPLTIAVYQYDPNEGGHGRLNAKTTPQSDTQVDINDPNTTQVNRGTVLNLTALADPGYKVQSWSGTDNDSSTALTNTVTMNSSRSVIVTFEPNGLYYLTVTVIDGNGTVIPSGRTLRTPGEVVTLTATPAKFGDVIIWTGTDNDGSDGQTNTVTMTGHKNVTVKFYTVRILHVGAGGDYPTIQSAIDAANDRDIIILMPSVQPYYTQNGFTIDGRDITITSINPDDPTVVASTVIQQQTGADAGVSPAFTFQNVGPLMRLWGITIRGFYVRGLNGLDGQPPQRPFDGAPGSGVGGMAISCASNASPTVKNCVINNCHATGGDGGNGAAGTGSDTNTAQINGGNGGWPGGAYGGAVLCANNSNPAFINCTFSNNSATGGNGGNGGNGNEVPRGDGGRGGGWYYGYPLPRPWYFGLPYGEQPRFYSGLGGAVCVGPLCTVTFESCDFINNISSGGLNGISGQIGFIHLRPEPTTAYRIDNLGGAVYLFPEGSAGFTNCTFTTNTADTNSTPASFDGILGYGGAVAADYGATTTFRNCSFSNNTSDIGGGIYSLLTYADVNECNFSGNNAAHGAGLLFCDSVAYITGSMFSGNIGIIAGSEGGAIGLLGTNAEVADCNIANNRAGGSGGGIYVSSKNVDGNQIEGDNYVLVKNCLITGNIADEDGGGISANWGAVVSVENCTLYNNQATGLSGDAGFGGGLSSAYNNTYVDIINSIIWNNVSPQGSQIAADVSSLVKVRFSDVGKSITVNGEPVEPNSLPVIRPGFDGNTLAATDDLSTGLINIGFMLNFFGNQYSSLYVNNNGNVTFDANMMTFTPFGLTSNIGTSIIAPFFADVDTRVGNLTAYGLNTIDGHAAFGATWNNVGYFASHTDKLNSFQIVLIDRSDRAPGDFDIEFNYQHILWETGDASGGVNGFGGSSAHAGFSNGTGVRGTYYEFEGSGVPGALLDSNPITGLIYSSRRSAVSGRYIFEVHRGLPTLLGGEPFYTENNSIDGFVWNTDSNSWEPNSGSHNISTDPCFAIDGEYYLSQIAAGQIYDSCCVNAGSADVNSPDINLSGYTTRTDGIHDVCTVDMGYHYPLFTPHQYSLTIEVNGVGGRLFALGRGDSNFTIEAPNSRLVNAKAVVSLQALADANYGVLRWTGTDNDASIDPNNTVTMDSDKVVKVQFHQYRLTIEVMGPNGLDPNGYLGANGTGVNPFTIRARVEPNSCGVAPGRVVDLNAVPDANFRVRVWMGTDNDACTTPTNTVTMNSDKTVRVGFEPNGLYYLTVTKIGNGTVSPVGRYLRRPGDVVTLNATPANPSDAIIWTGTDDDYSTARQNTVTMNGHRDVTVEFYTPRILYVGTDTSYPTIQFAIDAAHDRDIVMVTPGTYNIYESSKDRPYLYISGKEIRLTSTNPEDANATQIIGGFVIDNANRRLIIEGLTIRDAIYWKDYEIGGNNSAGIVQPGVELFWATPQGSGVDGYGGGTCRGAGMQLNGTASPTVRNCLFIHCVARGVHGANGAGGMGDDGYSGNGGPGGKAFGGGAYCGVGGSPLFEDCSFINCSAIAGSAGNGGGAAPNTGGHGGAWGDRNGVWWDEWKALYGAIHPLEEYWKYSGYGGAIYCDVNNTAEFVNCMFTGNSALGSSCGISGAVVPSGWPNQHYKIESFGGAVYAASGSAPLFVECNFVDNEANMQGPSTSYRDTIAPVNAYPNVSFGGAVAFEDGAAPEFNECTFNGNRATIGGGAFAAWAYGTVTDCNFEDNSSYSGGGILYVGGTSEIVNSRFTGNQSTVSAAQGGAITLLGADAEIRNCNIWNNTTTGSGGGIYVSSQDVEGSELPGGNSVLIKNCLIIGNSAGQNGAGISATWYSDPNIVNCTIADNNAQGMGGGLYSAYNNYTNVINSIFWDNNAPQGPQIAIGTTANPAYVKVTYSDIEGGAADVCFAPLTILEWDVASSNPHYPTDINRDPLFIGGFFLSQIAAGQISNSPCVDKGSANVNSPDINLGGYTTRTDSVNDVNIVDMGYHYSAFTPPLYHLTITPVDGLTPADITPGNGNYVWFSKVPLHVSATPPESYQVVWTGTDNDDISDGNNSVRMTGDKTVTVGFGKNTCNLTVIWNNGGSVTPTSSTYSRGAHVNLTATPNAGYRIQSWEGTDNDDLFTRTNTVTMNRDKTVRVTFSLPQTRTVPGDFTTIQEAVEAARSGDIVSVASGVYHGSALVLNKEITLTSTNPDDPCVVAATIIDSTGYQSGLALLFTAGATSNTVVDGFTITSGTYGIIAAQDATQAGQNGPDGGGFQGGTVYIDTGASPTLRNCVIRDTSVTGGNAGSGGNADATTPAGRGGWGGWAKGGGVYVAPFANPTLVNCTVRNCSVTGGNGGNGGNSTGTLGAGYQDANHGGLWSNDFSFPWRRMVGADGEPCYIGDYRFYSGYGGGVFCDANSEANFINCTITNNVARGGMSGIGGTRPQGVFIPDPITAYRIPSYGGGAYCGANSDINFVECVISGNVAPRPDATYHTDPYLGHGGGIAFEDTASIRLKNCTISDNNSAVGGGMFWSGGEPEVLDCDIARNTAYLGGGIYAMDSTGQIRGCTLHDNFAGASAGDVDVVAGQGGAIFGSSIDTVIVDCFLTNNTSSASGGGIHIYGPGDANTIIRNCLLVNNQAGRDGGGISTNWGAVVSVENCTLYNNQATGTFGELGNTGFGGGLYCSYEAQTDVKNSIIWDNNGIFGKQIAEGIGFVESGLTDKYYCGTVTVSYSDIQGGQASVLVSDGCPLVWGLGNKNIDPCFVNAVNDNFHLQQITAGQMLDSPCIDAGGDLAVSLGMFKYSTSTLGTSDTGIVDLGYHYPISEYCRKWDLYVDNFIDFRDFAVFASAWVKGLGNVGYGTDDLKEFTYCWLEELVGDMNAPTPNPMTWAIPSHPLTGNSVEMRASTAVDVSGQVYYQFEQVGGPLSTWQTSTYYLVTGLNPTGEYCFRVRARDKYNNVTAWSEPACVSDIGDVNSPTPAPTFVPVAAQNITRSDANTASGQFEWDPVNFHWDWWHRVIVDVTGVTDDITPTSELEVRFICTDPGNGHELKYSSDRTIPAAYLPIRIGHPVAIGERIPDGGGAASGSYRLTWNGTNRIVYEVYVDASGGSYGRQLDWHVCVYDASNNSACTATYTIPQ